MGSERIKIGDILRGKMITEVLKEKEPTSLFEPPKSSPVNLFKIGHSAIVLFSSGHYSLASLFWALDNFKTVETLSFEFSESICGEVQSAEHIASLVNIPHNIIFLKDTDLCYLLNSVPPVYREHYFIYTGILTALFKDFRNIVIGSQIVDDVIYNKLESFLGSTSQKYFKLHFPYKDISRTDVISKLSSEKNGDSYLEFSISCQSQTLSYCQKCDKCIARKEAFALLGKDDPLVRRFKKSGKI